jgi:hypothetical protein
MMMIYLVPRAARKGWVDAKQIHKLINFFFTHNACKEHSCCNDKALTVLCLHLGSKDGCGCGRLIIASLHGVLHPILPLHNGVGHLAGVGCLHNDDGLLATLRLQGGERLALQHLHKTTLARMSDGQCNF